MTREEYARQAHDHLFAGKTEEAGIFALLAIYESLEFLRQELSDLGKEAFPIHVRDAG